MDATKRAIAAGLPIKGFVLASPRPVSTFGRYTVGSLNEVVFFSNVFRTATIIRADKSSDLATEVLETLVEDH